jgi:HEAT repeat protein
MLGILLLDPKVAVPPLIAALGHNDPMTRLLAAEALARIGGPARVAIPALNRVSVDQNTYVRREASCRTRS